MYVMRNSSIRSANKRLPLATLAIILFAAGKTISLGQPVSFGNCPVGLTNAAGPWTYVGGSWNGTQMVMQVQRFVGPNATDFGVTPNLQGQTLPYGQSFPGYLTFAPKTIGSETATLTNYETPNPPFGGGNAQMQGTGVASTPASGPVVPELLPLQQAMTNYLLFHHFGAGTLAMRMN